MNEEGADAAVAACDDAQRRLAHALPPAAALDGLVALAVAGPLVFGVRDAGLLRAVLAFAREYALRVAVPPPASVRVAGAARAVRGGAAVLVALLDDVGEQLLAAAEPAALRPLLADACAVACAAVPVLRADAPADAPAWRAAAALYECALYVATVEGLAARATDVCNAAADAASVADALARCLARPPAQHDDALARALMGAATPAGTATAWHLYNVARPVVATPEFNRVTWAVELSPLQLLVIEAARYPLYGDYAQGGRGPWQLAPAAAPGATAHAAALRAVACLEPAIEQLRDAHAYALPRILSFAHCAGAPPPSAAGLSLVLAGAGAYLLHGERTTRFVDAAVAVDAWRNAYRDGAGIPTTPSDE
jgi:hypothetical protein